jgi:hypothetical protein
MSYYPVKHVHIKSSDLVIEDLQKWLETVGTRIIKTLTVTSSGTALYTVPSGKSFYLVICASYNSGAYAGRIVIKDNTGIAKFMTAHIAQAYNPAILAPAIPIVLLAGWSIAIELDGGTEYSSVYGYEV